MRAKRGEMKDATREVDTNNTAVSENHEMTDVKVEVGQRYRGRNVSTLIHEIVAVEGERLTVRNETVTYPALQRTISDYLKVFVLISPTPTAAQEAPKLEDEIDWASVRSFCRHDAPDGACGICRAEQLDWEQADIATPDAVARQVALANRAARLSRAKPLVPGILVQWPQWDRW